MRRNNMHKAFAGLLAMIVIMCAAVIGWTVAEPSTEQTTAPDPGQRRDSLPVRRQDPTMEGRGRKSIRNYIS